VVVALRLICGKGSSGDNCLITRGAGASGDRPALRQGAVRRVVGTGLFSSCQTQVAYNRSKTIRGAIEAYVRGYTQFLACPRLYGGRRAFSGARGDRIRQRS
jgi:hypothetical protein